MSPFTRRGAVGLVLLACLLVAGSLMLTSSGGRAQHPRVLWGVQEARAGAGSPGIDLPEGDAAGGVRAFARDVRKRPSVVPLNRPFISCDAGPCTWVWFPVREVDAIRKLGAVPMLNWSSMSSPLSATEPGYQLTKVVRGDFDNYIRDFATSIKRWGHPLFLRFNWEMNGSWFPWAEAANNNRKGESAAAWRHVHKIFDAVGAHNVTWVWCPNVATERSTAPLSALRGLYPGDAYVDWTCLDGYNWGTAGEHAARWRSFDTIFRSTYLELVKKIAPSKPVMIGEVASSTSGGSKNRWIAGMFASLARSYPQVRAVIWFDHDQDGADWSLPVGSKEQSEFARGVKPGWYASSAKEFLAPSGKISPP